MDPSPGLAAWGGATWIGGGNDDLVLYSPYLAVFDARYAVTIAPGSTRASFVYGANDSRLMDRNKNVYQVQNARDTSYIKLELDISALGGSTRTRRRSCTCTAPAIRTPTTRRSRSRPSTSTTR